MRIPGRTSRGSEDELVAVAAAAAAALTGHELYAFPAAHPARPRVRAAAPAPWCARPRRHRARPRPLQVKGARLPLATAGEWQAPTGPLPFPPPQDPHPDVLWSHRWALGRNYLVVPITVLCLVLSPAWFCVLAPYLISHPSNQGASQGHVLPRLRQLPGKCLSLR